MSGCHCPEFPACMNVSDTPRLPTCEKDHCPGKPKLFHIFAPDACKHDFDGWREHKNEAGQIIGGEQVCKHCGMSAMAYTLAVGP